MTNHDPVQHLKTRGITNPEHHSGVVTKGDNYIIKGTRQNHAVSGLIYSSCQKNIALLHDKNSLQNFGCIL